MRVVVVGASGMIGRAIVHELSKRHEIISVGNRSGEFRVDITNPKSIKDLYNQIENFDALVAAVGEVHFGPLEEMTSQHYQLGLQHKLMGQVNLVLEGLNFINERGSFTLTSGILSHDPVRFGTGASMVNGAIDSFVKAASIELPKWIRINSVSPSVIKESMPQFESYFRGYETIPAQRAALAYSKSVEGLQTGQTYRVV